jgi:hypothetical protein
VGRLALVACLVILPDCHLVPYLQEPFEAYHLRTRLAETEQTVLDQLNVPTTRPTTKKIT